MSYAMKAKPYDNIMVYHSHVHKIARYAKTYGVGKERRNRQKNKQTNSGKYQHKESRSDNGAVVRVLTLQLKGR